MSCNFFCNLYIFHLFRNLITHMSSLHVDQILSIQVGPLPYQIPTPRQYMSLVKFLRQIMTHFNYLFWCKHITTITSNYLIWHSLLIHDIQISSIWINISTSSNILLQYWPSISIQQNHYYNFQRQIFLSL